MYEYSSVSASSYDPGALVAKLNEAAADGWDVVSIVPTGGDVSAFLCRESLTPEEEALLEEVAIEEEILEEEIAEEAAIEEAVEEAIVEEEIAEEIAIEEAASDSWSAGDTAAVAAVAAAGDQAPLIDGPDDAAEEVIDVVEVTEVAEAVDEPSGWAVAPDAAASTGETVESAVVEEIPVVAAGAAVVEEVPEPVAVVEPSPEPSPAPAPAPAPAPEPAPVVTTPAGWYPDPSTRYELRYWDGTQWTEHVARQGQQFTDPPVR
jgi:hypothetical protein